MTAMSNRLSPSHPKYHFIDLLHNLRGSMQNEDAGQVFKKKIKNFRTVTAEGADPEASTLGSVFFPPHL